MMTKRDYENILYTAEQRGLQAGLAQGRAEGEKMGVEKVREEMSNENALRMLKKGYSVSDISEVEEKP